MKKRVLIAEDEEGTGEILATVLNQAGYSVTWCKDGTDALNEYKKENYPVVLTDLTMPQMDGNELIRCIRSINSEQIIIVLSGVDDQDSIIDTMRTGIFDYIVKPAKKQKLLYKVNRAFETSELRSIRNIAEKERLVKLEHDLEWYKWNEGIVTRDYDRFDQTLFSNLNDSFNQGSGFGTLVTVLAIISDSITEKNGTYSIDKNLYEMIQTNALIAKSVLNTFTDISTILTNKLETEIVTCHDIYEQLLTLRLEVKDKLKLKNQTLLIADDFDLAQKINVSVNRKDLKRVFLEIIINAMKFSKDNSKIYVFFKTNKKELLLSFLNTPSDNGKDFDGIPPEYATVILEPFYRIDKRVYDGYNTLDFGLGLTLIDKIIRKHGGVIEVQNINDMSSLNEQTNLKVMVTIRLTLNK